jgi:uncharacterized protein (DUF433 family)
MRGPVVAQRSVSVFRYETVSLRERKMSLYAQQRVRREPGICGGVLCIPEERMPVPFILRCFASGMSHRDILHAYPQLSEEDLRLALLAAAERLEGDDEAAAG